MSKTEVTFTLNGEQRTFYFEPNLTLSDALRRDAGLTSIKRGCERGDCGSCTIIMNGDAVKSCLILGIEAAGSEITTLEGIMKDGITPLQDALLKANSFQCGYCAPGMIMAATDMLNHNKKPNKEEINESLSGNLCRCTGYSPIVDAIVDHVKGGKQ